MTTSNTITKTDLMNILSAVIPNAGVRAQWVSDQGLIACSTANTLFYTGKNITIPANSFFAITAVASYSQAKPNAVTINTDSTHNTYNVATGGYFGYMSSCSYVGQTGSTAQSYYAWANYASTATSAGTITLQGFYIEKSSLNDGVDYIVEQGTSGNWTYRKWNSGIAECWGRTSVPSTTYSANGGYKNVVSSLPSGLFNNSPNVVEASGRIQGTIQTMIGFTAPNSATEVQTYLVNRTGSSVTNAGFVDWNIKGTWK